MRLPAIGAVSSLTADRWERWRANDSTLFVDRDGVINRKVPGDYVREWSQFEFLPGAEEALVSLATCFTSVIVVTNQRGVGRGLMSESTLVQIHRSMVSRIEQSGGRIDGVYYCPHDAPVECRCRKPAPGLVRQAMIDRPVINLAHSLVVGDSDCDMRLARGLGVPGLLIDPVSARGQLGSSNRTVYESLAHLSASIGPPLGRHEGAAR
jgi:D-glycero-D-manno-heptose 1,7-bisphosphate phosphatase